MAQYKCDSCGTTSPKAARCCETPMKAAAKKATRIASTKKRPVSRPGGVRRAG